MRVIYAEESEALRRAIRPMFDGYASQLVELDDVGQLPLAVRQHAPDIVVLPESEGATERGRAISALVQRASPRTRLLLLGTTTESARRRSLIADACLPYPFDAERLGRALCSIAHPDAAECVAVR